MEIKTRSYSEKFTASKRQEMAETLARKG